MVAVCSLQLLRPINREAGNGEARESSPRSSVSGKGPRSLPDVCRSAGRGLRRQPRSRVWDRFEGGNSSDSEEDQSTSSTENQGVPNSHRVPDSKLHPPHIKIDIIRKVQAKDTQRYKVEYDSQSTDTLNLSSESKQETEYGPCRREMEDTLNHLKILNVLSPRGFHIPNCDKKGFYKKKQCRPSKGRKRGYCWCVDKYGQPLPGYDGKGKGDVHCYNLESK
ncbi:insulin-like growth factor-binding protein 3 [Manacus vitellinus]|uniref:insulin-like growth factor-binding protein 3 n=1 Tax=Manacus vitellinus TaxID=328815 RepID=UPI00115EA5EC|nr:insulin-like growth factor-binding protein 3 [Manacus vitellinus]